MTMINGKVWLLLIILTGLILGSCQSQTHEAIATATVIIKPSDTQAPTVVNTPQPTETIYPSATLENIYEMVITPTPETLVVRDVMSPNRRWQAIVMRTFVGGEERSIFKVQNDGSRVVWIVEDVAYEEVPVGGFPFPEPFYWSTNGQYLYYTYQTSGDGCFAGGRHKGDGLFRLDLATGNITELMSNFASWMSISPDEKTLAYFFYSRQGLTLRDLVTGDERTLDQIVFQENIGMLIDQSYIVWAPDSRSLVFVVMAGVCDYEPESYSNWLVQVDLTTGTQRILFENDERRFVPLSWPEINKLLLRSGSGQLWWLNPTTGVIETVP